uniref:Uncharacterized protein n=1 Tax=Glossina austeni TaxID=7395 RepID=A0A1A9V195_GLOAU
MELGHVAAIYIKNHDCLKANSTVSPSVYKYKDWIKFVDEQLDDDDTVYEIYDTDSFPEHNNANNSRDDYYSFYNDYDIDYIHDMDESARFLALELAFAFIKEMLNVKCEQNMTKIRHYVYLHSYKLTLYAYNRKMHTKIEQEHEKM